MRRALLLTCACVVFVAAGPLASAESVPFEHCMAPAADTVGGTATLRVEAIDRAGESTESQAQLAWRTGDGASRVLLEMLAPDEISGSRMLLIAADDEKPEAWAYLPEIAKVKRVGARHLRKPLFGTTITYADLERAGLVAEDGEVDSWTEAKLGDRPVWQIEARAGREQITSWLDRELCAPLRTEVKDRKGRLARVIEVSPEAFDFGSDSGSAAPSWVPRHMLVRDVLEGSETRVTVEAFAPADVAARFFDPQRLAPITTHALAPTP